MEAFKDPPSFDIGYRSSLGSSFVMKTQTHARRMAKTNLLKQDEKLGWFTSSRYIFHTKAMTAQVEYRTR